MNPTRIVVHNTANDSSARNEIQYMINNRNEVSYYYAIDDKEIVQGIPENRNTWHAGDDGKNHLKFDQEKYNAYIKEQQKQEAMEEGQKMQVELQQSIVLSAAIDNQAFIMRYLYPEWSGESVSYNKNDRFMYHDKFYKVLQGHTSQADWTPDTASSLYVEIADPAEEWPEFKQPIGAHDAYAKDAKVTFESKHYKSLIDANVYSPTAYPQGWELVE